MVALVTGANGFIGSHLCEQLKAEGHRVRAMVRRTSDLSWIAGLNLELVYADLCRPETLDDAVAGADWIFHAGAALRPRQEADYTRVNATGTRALAEACIKSGVKRLVFFSSAAAAGPASGPDCPRSESDPAQPVSRYGEGKLAAEASLQALAGLLHSVILRFPAVYGPRDRDILKVIRSITRGVVPVFGGTFSVVYVTDAVRASILAAEKPVASGAAYYVTDGGCYSYADVARVAEEFMGRRPVRLRIPSWSLDAAAWMSELLGRPGAILSRDKARELAQQCWVCSPARAQAELGFEPCYDLERGLKETMRWYREMNWL